MFRRNFIAAGAALLVLGQAAAAETLTVTASGSLNMRSGPGTGYRVVGQLARGVRVETLESASGWVKVRSPSGTVGWVSSSYLGSLGGQGGAQGNAAPGEGRPNGSAPGGNQPSSQSNTPSQLQSNAPQSNGPGQSQTHGAAPQGNGDTLRVQAGAGYLNLRSGPGTGYSVVLRMQNGQSVTVLERSGSWVRIRLSNGTSGWAYGSYLSN